MGCKAADGCARAVCAGTIIDEKNGVVNRGKADKIDKDGYVSAGADGAVLPGYGGDMVRRAPDDDGGLSGHGLNAGGRRDGCGGKSEHQHRRGQ